MSYTSLSIKTNRRRLAYDIHVGSGVLSKLGGLAVDTFEIKPRRAAVISNPAVSLLYGERVVKSLEKVGFKTSVWLMNDGEKYKSLTSAERALSFLSERELSRTDIVISLGGGVVGDLAGFASSIYLRGVPFIQIPTTLLSMIDSSVGGKTGVNSSFGKNLIGSFYAPSLVVADVETLKTLPRREMTAGLCEAVKQGAISGRSLFDKTAGFLKGGQVGIMDLIVAQISFKASIVSQDGTEDPSRVDSKSRKILNFGHTFAHALEKTTDYRYFRHGEAVGYGILFAANLSNSLELLDENTLNLLNDVVRRTGSLPSLRKVEPKKVFEAFQADKKVISGSLQWILLAGIGKPVILPGSQVPNSAIKKTLTRIFDDN